MIIKRIKALSLNIFIANIMNHIAKFLLRLSVIVILLLNSSFYNHSKYLALMVQW